MGDTKLNNVELIEELEHTKTLDQVATMGTVKLTDGDIVYIPTPTADPQDPRTFSPRSSRHLFDIFWLRWLLSYVAHDNTDSTAQSTARLGKNG